ncbi:MAG TPA: hypothetical protein VEB63_01465 [Chitinophagaceae bacterium]|nr:hypothetical protein [Chitinophagaceae bacterium]
MNKTVFAVILFVLAIAAIGYAIYRSPGEMITLTEGGRQTVYGGPQHGLNAGLGVFAGACVIAGVLLLLDSVRASVQDQRMATRKAADRLASNYPVS